MQILSSLELTDMYYEKRLYYTITSAAEHMMIVVNIVFVHNKIVIDLVIVKAMW